MGYGGIDMGRFEAGDERSRGSIHLDLTQIGQQLLRSIATRLEFEQLWMLVDEVPAIGRDKLNVHPFKKCPSYVSTDASRKLCCVSTFRRKGMFVWNHSSFHCKMHMAHSHLDTPNSELLERSDHLGGCIRVIPRMGDDLDEQGVVVGRNDGARKGGGRVQTDAHSLARTEHLNSARVWLETAGWVLGRHSALDG